MNSTFDSESGGRLLVTGQTGIRAECWPLSHVCVCVYNCVSHLKYRNPVVSLQLADRYREISGDNQVLIILCCKVLSRALVSEQPPKLMC